MNRLSESNGVIGIGADCGGPNTGALSSVKVDLWKCLRATVRASYCTAIDRYELVLRISGSLDDFGPETIDHLRRRRVDRYIAADIVVPIGVWKPLTFDETKRYLAVRVRAAIVRCCERLLKDREDIDVATLLRDVDAGIKAFLDAEPGETPNNRWSGP